jgi:hypothetical protein
MDALLSSDEGVFYEVSFLRRFRRSKADDSVFACSSWFVCDGDVMTWTLLSVKIPPELHKALAKQGNVPLFVRQTLAAALGVKYQEKLPGLAGATPRTRKRVSKAGVKGRTKPN